MMRLGMINNDDSLDLGRVHWIDTRSNCVRPVEPTEDHSRGSSSCGRKHPLIHIQKQPVEGEAPGVDVAVEVDSTEDNEAEVRDAPALRGHLVRPKNPIHKAP